jgi:hypothetical protein
MKSKKINLILAEDMFEKGDQLSTQGSKIEIVREQYSRWWERLISWLSKGRWFTADSDNIVYIVKMVK